MSRRWRYPRPRRGVFYGPQPTPVVQAPPSYVPTFQEPSGRNSRLAGMRVRRGRFFAVPPLTVAPAVAAWVPALLDPARRASARPTRRGEFFAIPLVGASPPQATAIPRIPSRRPRLLFNRRGHFWTTPPATRQPCPARITSRRARFMLHPAGRVYRLPLSYAPVVPYSPLLDPVTRLRTNNAGANPRRNGTAAGARPTMSAATVRPNQAEATT